MDGFYDDMEVRSTLRRGKDNNLRLSAMVDAACRRSTRVREMLNGLNLKPSDIASVADLEKLPVISREEVVELQRQEPPFGGLCAADVDAA